MAKITLRIEDELLNELNEIAERQEVSVSELVRNIIKDNKDKATINERLQQLDEQMQEFRQMINDRMQEINETLRVGQNWIAGQEMAYVQQLVNLEILVRTGIYIGCQAMQMLKCKAFNIMSLTREQYEKFKEFFDTAAQLAKQDLTAILEGEHPYATEAVHMLPSDSLDGLVRELVKREKEKMQKK
jgi:predicted DNA-binding ribbon-helix-helix protein